MKNIIQNDEEWLKWRFEGLGGSDAPVYISINNFNFSKYQTRKGLLKEKIHRKAKKNNNSFITSLGHRTEVFAREITKCMLSFREWRDINLNPVCAENETHPFMRASLDGYSEEINLPWECKLVGKDKFKKISEGACPDDFFCQTQHQMFVTEQKEILLTAVWLQFGEGRKPIINYKNISHIIIKRDDKFIKNTLVPQALDFWLEVVKGRSAL